MRFAMPKKILIIEDDPVIVKYLQAIFSDNGYQSCVATSSMEGLEVVRKEKPDLITLDLQLPGEWGPRFYRKLRKDKEYRDIPVIVVSGIDGDHAVKNAVVAFVKKPFDPEKLIGIVKNTIG
jgi:CheY-like chemotaxis protein